MCLRTHVGLLCLLLGLPMLLIQGQDFVENAVRSDGILQPEVGKFKHSSVENVDFRGDLNVAIPVLTVPGRGGLDYPIILSYKSGIQTTQKSSWVGLGWSLNEGCISRTVNFLPDFNHERNATTPSNFPEAPDTYVVTLPGHGSSFMLPVPWGFPNAPQPLFYLQDWRKWKIDSRTGFYKSKRRIAYADANNHFILDQYGSPSTQDFSMVNFWLHCDMEGNPNISWIDSCRAYRDLSSFSITTEDGTRYDFQLVLKSDMEYAGVVTEYNSTWRLTSITSHDYIDVNHNGPDDEDMGNWIRLEYGYPYEGTEQQIRDIRPGATSPSQMYSHGHHALLSQTTYLKKVVTPTHEAIFHTSPKNDVGYDSPIPYQEDGYSAGIKDYTLDIDQGQLIKALRLDRIELRSRCPVFEASPVVEKVIFSYAPQGNELAQWPQAGLGKSTLAGIWFEDDAGNVMPGYDFKYTKDIDGFNPNYYQGDQYCDSYQAVGPCGEEGPFMHESYWRKRTGRFGYFFSKPEETPAIPVASRTKGAVAWSLRTIEYPTGLTDTIDYENDAFDRSADSSRILLGQIGFPWNGVFWNLAGDECGIRVSRITSYDPLEQSVSTVRYAYNDRPFDADVASVGHLPGLPVSYLRTTDPRVGIAYRIKTLFDWSTNEVEYPFVSRIFPDSSIVTTMYVTAEDSGLGLSANAFYNRQFITAYSTQGCTLKDSHVISEDRGWIRGRVKCTTVSRYTNGQYQIYRRERSFYDMQDPLEDPPAIMDIMTVPGLETFRYRSKWTPLVRTDVAEFNPGTVDSILHFTSYGYDIATGLLIHTEESVDRNVTKVTSKGYAYSDPDSSALAEYCRAKNYLSAPLWETTMERIGFPCIPDQQAFFDFAGGGGGKFYKEEPPDSGAYKTYTRLSYRMCNRLQVRAFRKRVWVDRNGDGAMEASEMDIAFNDVQYDPFGNAISLQDANSSAISLQWSPDYNHSKLTFRTHAGLSRSFEYQKRLLVRSITDENNETSVFEYDGFGRLTKAWGPDQKLLKEVEYNLRRP